MDLQIKKAVLHILDTHVDAPVTSEYLLESEDSLAYLAGIAGRAFQSEDAKPCGLPAGTALAGLLERAEQDFLPVTVRLAESWFAQLTAQPSIPAGDVAFLLLTLDGRDYFAALKLNYKVGMAHYFEMRGEAASNEIVRQATMLPGASGKADEAFFAELAPQPPYPMRLLEKKYELDGRKQAYLGRMLEIQPGLSPREKMEAIREVATQVNQQFYGSTGVEEPEVAAAVCAEYRAAKTAASRPDAPPWEPAPIEDLCDALYGQLPHAKEAFAKALAETGIAMDEPLPITPLAVRRMEKQSLRSAVGVEIKVPVDIYRDSDALEFIKNPDGTVKLLIKNVLV